MRTVYIMVEGPTEEEFVNNSLSAYLIGFNIQNVVPILLETSPGFYGGDITYERYKSNAVKLLYADPNAIVTSLIDFYQLRCDFPDLIASKSISGKIAQVNFLENAISQDINNERMIPYIQLHEFEGILFSDISGFQYIPKADLGKAQYIINHYPNPELVNDDPSTAPSVRLKGIIPRYKKPLHGPIIALKNGITPVLTKCTRFRNWVETLIQKATMP